MTEVTIRLRFKRVEGQGTLGEFIDRLLKSVQDDEAMYHGLEPALMEHIVIETTSEDR